MGGYHIARKGKMAPENLDGKTKTPKGHVTVLNEP
jgi:hypothetical protein